MLQEYLNDNSKLEYIIFRKNEEEYEYKIMENELE
jgi:hypothetical protein